MRCPSAEPCDLAHGVDAAVVQLAFAVIGPTPQSRSTGRGCRNSSSPIGFDDEQAVGLGDPAGHLGEELGAGHPDRDRQPDPFEHVGAQSLVAISQGVPAIRRKPLTSRKASSIESPSTTGVTSSNTSNTALLASV